MFAATRTAMTNPVLMTMEALSFAVCVAQLGLLAAAVA